MASNVPVVPMVRPPAECASCQFSRLGLRIRRDDASEVMMLECHINPPTSDTGFPIVPQSGGWCAKYQWNGKRVPANG